MRVTPHLELALSLHICQELLITQPCRVEFLDGHLGDAQSVPVAATALRAGMGPKAWGVGFIAIEREADSKLLGAPTFTPHPLSACIQLQSSTVASQAVRMPGTGGHQ